jgi:hypothetical protein
MTRRKLSHVKVFVIINFITAFTFTPSVALAEDYLMKFVMNGQTKGEYLVSREATQVVAEPGLWQAVGVNATNALPLDRLKNLGRVNIVWSEQTIYFHSQDKQLKSKKDTPEITIKPSLTALDVKSIDYFLAHQSAAALNGSLIATGRIAGLDLDVRTGIGEDDSYFSSQWHNEDNQWLKDLEIGRVQRYGLNGLSLTNESSLSTGTFSTDQIELYWPVGTRIDVYRDSVYIESVVLDSDPFIYQIELDYSHNKYEFRALLQDGRTDTRIVERSISGRLAQVSKFNYSIAAGQNPGANDNRLIGYLAYGLTNNLSLFTGRDEHERQFVSALYAQNDLSFEPAWYGDSGWSVNSNWQNDIFSAFGRFSRLEDYHQQSLNFSYQGLFKPSIILSLREHNGYKVSETAIRTFHNSYLEFFKTSLALSPNYSVRSSNGIDQDVMGGRIFANMPDGWLAVASYEYEKQDTVGLNSIQRFDGEISKRFTLGRFTYRYSATDFGHGWEPQQQTLRADIWQWKFATVSLTASHSAARENSFALSISGSLGKAGFSRIQQRNQAALELTTCRDLNSDGLCQEDEPEVKGVKAQVGSIEVVTPAILDSLTPYRRYDIQISSDFGLLPRYSSVETGQLMRGGLNRLRLPLSEVREIEGKLEDDGIRVALIDKTTNSVLSEQTTEFGGWYLFYAPAHKLVEVVPFDELKLSHVKVSEHRINR